MLEKQPTNAGLAAVGRSLAVICNDIDELEELTIPQPDQQPLDLAPELHQAVNSQIEDPTANYLPMIRYLVERRGATMFIPATPSTLEQAMSSNIDSLKAYFKPYQDRANHFDKEASTWVAQLDKAGIPSVLTKLMLSYLSGEDKQESVLLSEQQTKANSHAKAVTESRANISNKSIA